MHNIKKLKLNSAGDTILEVLISVSILSLILTSSFALTNRSSIANRQAAERGEASKVAQSEIEKLKYYLSSPGITSPANNSFFCVDTTNPAAPTTVPVSITTATIDTAYNSVPNACKKGTDQRYAVFIYREPTGSEEATNTYTTYVRWDSASGRGPDKISAVHRLYPDTAASLTSVANPGAIGFTPPSVTVSGNIRASADNYLGWPIMETTFSWSDGSTNTRTDTVSSAHGGAPGTYPFSFTKLSAVTLVSVSIRMTNDAFGASPGQDRNLYVHDYTVAGQGTYGHASGVASGCSHAPYFYTGSDAKIHCSGDTVTYFVGTVAQNGISSISCNSTLSSHPCNFDPFNSPGYSLADFACVNFASTYSFANGGRNLYISYGDNTGCSGAPTPATGSTGYRYNLNIYVNGALRATVNNANVQAGNLESVRSIDLGSNVAAGAQIRVEWTNNMWVPSDANPTYDPDFAIYRIGVVQ